MLEKGDEITLETKEKLMIEAKFLANRDIYKHMFQKISEGMKRDYKSLTLFQNNLLDRSFFRRERLVKGDSSAKHEKTSHFRSDNDKKKRMIHRECMQNLKLHREEFMEWHRKKLKERKKLSNQVKGHIETKKKEKEEIEEKKKIARLKELKAQNMEVYLDLVEEEKKNKIKELLGQTNQFLK